MKEIELTKGYSALVDDEDYAALSAYNWHATVARHAHSTQVYATRNFAKRENAMHQQIAMHRQIMGAAHGIEVDHIDGNGLNNQRSNLRLATRAQNGHNRLQGNTIKSVTGLVGVFYCDPARYPMSAKKPFKAHIKFNSKRIHVGYFATAAEAVAARDELARKLHGEFAKLNRVAP